MDLGKSIRQLPNAALKALKDYFAGLRFFFNRENWSHSLVFIVTLTVFLALALLQRTIRFLFFDPINVVIPFIRNAVLIAYLGGCGAFVGFLLLGVIAFFTAGQKLMFNSRFRHFISPLVIIGFAFLFIFILPRILQLFPNIENLLFNQNGLFDLVFRGCWIVFVFLQTILLGYTVVKSIKWISGYLNIPEKIKPTWKYWIALVGFIFLIPFAIMFWFPIMLQLMVPPRIPPEFPPIWFPPYVRWLLEQSPLDYVFYLLIATPFIAIIAAIVLWRWLPQVSIALASFGLFYPVLVYYYRLRVIQYFFYWSDLVNGIASVPSHGYVFFELFLLFITFALALLGAAKLQHGVTPNPFGLFAVMIGTLVFATTWVLSVNNPMFGIEYYGMITAALSAFLAVFVFVILPIAYGIYRMKRFPAISEYNVNVENTENLSEL